jgi:hypothetical protein
MMEPRRFPCCAQVLGVLLGLLVMLALSLSLGAADPGGKDDPLVTMSYVKGMAQFTRSHVAAGKGVKLGPGAEFVVLDPAAGPIDARGIDASLTGIVDLSRGEPAGGVIAPFHHYVNAGQGDQYVKFMQEATLLLRGDWR